LPVFGYYKRKSGWSYLCLFCFVAFLISAHVKSGFDAGNPKPTSLLYVLDADEGSAQWATYENQLSDWTKQYIGKTEADPKELAGRQISSKYSTGFSYVKDAPLKEIPAPSIEKTRDTIIGEERVLNIRISPQRTVNRLEVYTNSIPVTGAQVNGIPLSSDFLEVRNGGRLFTHYISDNEPTELELYIPTGTVLELTFYEASNDLLTNPLFSIPPRPSDAIPMPFVLNDAILVVKTEQF
jgi:hypothetical protein